MTKIYNVDLLDCNAHLLNGLNGEINSLISSVYYRYGKHISFNVIMPSTCMNICKTLSSISSPIHSCQANGNFTYKNSKRIDETYIFCSSNSTCNTAVTDLKKDSKSIYLFILDPNIIISGIVPDYVRTMSLSLLSQRLLCPQHHALTPLPFYPNKSKLSSCGCFCPVGYTLQKGKCVKISSIMDIHQQCQWIQKQFTYLQSEYCEKGKCEIHDLFNKVGLTTLPFPDDTYLNFANNSGDFFKEISGPRIVLEITKEVGVNMEVKQWFTPRTFTWQDYQLNRESILSHYIHLDSAGKYVITLKAYGYNEKPAICTTVISAKDNFFPKVISNTVTCPMVNSATVAMSYDNYMAAKTTINNFNHWSNSVVNDAFGSDKRCDKVEYRVQNIGDKQFSHSCISTNVLEFKEEEIKNIKKSLSDLILSNEAVEIKNGYCTKCFSLFNAPAELTTFYDFPTPNSKVGTWTVDKCVSSTSCNVSQCLTLNSNDLFSITAGITSSYVSSTKALMNSRFPTVGYNPETEIHLSSSCADLKQSSCQFTDVLHNLITIRSSFISNWSSILGKLVPDTSALLRYRYNINGGKWEEFTITSKVVLSELINTITIEAYSACGKVGKALTLTIILHPSTIVSVCDNMEKLGWFQSTTGKPLNGETRMSNYPGADFGEFSFSYDGVSESNEMHMTSFDSINCSIAYIVNNTISQSVIIIPKTNKSVVEHFAVNFIRNPTTMETTKLRMSCTSTFINANKISIPSTCNKELVFHYTNEVQWNCPNGDCLLKCPTNQPRPGQICQGKVISYFNGQTLYENIEQPKICCKSCGNTNQCRPLSSSEPLGLMQCSNDDTMTITGVKLFSVSNNNSSMSQVSPPFLTIVGISAIGIALLITYRRKHHMSGVINEEEYNNTDDNYRMLLA